MKKILFVAVSLLFVLAFTGCGVGHYSVSSGREDAAALSFESSKEMPIVVSVDGQSFETSTVKKIAHKTRRDIKKTAKYLIQITPGTHDVKVTKDGAEVFSKKIFVSTGETKIIEL